MDQKLKDQTLDKLASAQSVLVAVSQSSGFDGLASALAVYLSIAKLAKGVSVIGKEPSVGDAQKLYAVDKIGKSGGVKNLVIVINDAVKNVDKITHYLDENKLKVVVHPLSGTKGASNDDISFEETTVKPDFIFALGFKDKGELEKGITPEQLKDSEAWIVSLNKGQSQNFAQVNLTNPSAASLSECAGQMLSDLALPIDEDIAFNLYSGIQEATDKFAPSKSTPLSFQVAATLLKFGAGRAGLAQSSQSPTRFSPRPMSQPTPQRVFSDLDQKPIEEVEVEEGKEEDWLKPPKIYKGSKSFDKEG